MADIGQPQRYVEFEPMPTTAPQQEPAPVVVPTEESPDA